MNAYKLDEHLKCLCDQHKRFENLYSTWTLNKKTCSELLKDVGHLRDGDQIRKLRHGQPGMNLRHLLLDQGHGRVSAAEAEESDLEKAEKKL